MNQSLLPIPRFFILSSAGSNVFIYLGSRLTMSLSSAYWDSYLCWFCLNLNPFILHVHTNIARIKAIIANPNITTN